MNTTFPTARRILWPAILALAACRQPSLPAGLDQEARAFVRLVAVAQIDSALARLDSTLRTPAARANLEAGHRFLSPFPPDSIAPVAWEITHAAGTSAMITYELSDSRQWALVSVGVTKAGDRTQITGMRWSPSAGPMAHLNAFTLRGRTPLQYAVLAVAALAALFSIGTAVFAARQRLGWIWVLAALIGVGQVSVNWSTGARGIRLLAVQLFSAGMMRSGPVGPWIISFGLPLGAILALLVWSRRRRVPGSGPNPA